MANMSCFPKKVLSVGPSTVEPCLFNRLDGEMASFDVQNSVG